MKTGTPGASGSTASSAAADGTSGAGAASHAAPSSGSSPSVASASVIGAPSCSIRTETAEYVRPARSTVAATSSGPTAGAATKCSASERSGRPVAASAARAATAAR